MPRPSPLSAERGSFLDHIPDFIERYICLANRACTDKIRVWWRQIVLKRLKTLSKVAAAIVALSSPALAQSYITGDVNLRTGPNKSYQSVGVLARGTAVNVYGCTPTGWCEVSTGANYGWASSRYIETYRQPAYAP